MNEIKYISINEEIPSDKNKLCIFYDGEYYIDTYNNLSSTDQKQLLKWSYLPLIDDNKELEMEKMIDEGKRSLDNLKQMLERVKNYSALDAIERLEKENETLTKENDILVRDLGCETCSITDEYKELNAKIRELEEKNEKLKTELMHLKGCEQCKDRPMGELATVCPTEYENHCIGQKMTYIKELEKENEELKKDKEWLDKTDNEQTEVILNLYAQIRKMKCCGNCKFFDGCTGDYLKKGFRDYIDELKQPCDEWELSE